MKPTPRNPTSHILMLIPMFRTSLLLLCCSALGIVCLLCAESSPANAPVWSKSAVSFPGGCFEDNRKECKAFKILSPDAKSFVQVSYVPNPLDSGLELVSLEVIRDGKPLGPVAPPGTVENEIAWAPDSKAFFINGNNNANTDYQMVIYRLEETGITAINPAKEALQDMVRSFPPCRAKNPYDKCEELAKKPEEYIGVAGLDWTDGSSAVVVMAEVTCSSSMGGIMCAVLGYEIEIPSGKILRRMEPKEFARRWQHSMAWKFHDPGPPEFAEKGNGFTAKR